MADGWDTWGRGARADLLGFLDSLYAGAAALGVARFIDQYTKVAGDFATFNWSWAGVAPKVVPSVSLIVALGLVIDDWRYARWVNLDYGLRVSENGNAVRFWCECANAVLAFFLISSSFSDPTLYLTCLGLHFAVGWIWSFCLQREIRGYIDDNGGYPRSCHFGLTLKEAKIIRPGAPERADYRVFEAFWSHGFLAAAFLGTAAYVGWMLTIMTVAKPTERLLAVPTLLIATGGPAIVLVGLKAAHVGMKRSWLARRASYQEQSKGGQQ